MAREKIVESILEPSKEIAPLYVSMVLELKDGTTLSGIGVDSGGAENVQVRDATGKVTKVKADEIVSRRAEKISIMPDNLIDGLTVREMKDLVAYLAQQK